MKRPLTLFDSVEFNRLSHLGDLFSIYPGTSFQISDSEFSLFLPGNSRISIHKSYEAMDMEYFFNVVLVDFNNSDVSFLGTFSNVERSIRKAELSVNSYLKRLSRP